MTKTTRRLLSLTLLPLCIGGGGMALTPHHHWSDVAAAALVTMGLFWIAGLLLLASDPEAWRD